MKKIIRAIIIFFAFGIILYSGYKLIHIYNVYAEGDELYENFAHEYVVIDFNNKIEDRQSDDMDNEDEISLIVDFKSLLSINQDLVGWIYSENSPINYPVVQGYDNDYYLERMLDKSYNIAGSIFMDYRNSPDLSDFNTIIYGHNLRNESMFGTLKEYDNQEYYDKHPNMYFSTPNEDYKIELISGYKTDIRSNIYNLPQTAEELQILVDEVTRLSSFESNASFQEGDRLITLSTCSGGERTSRYILIGKLINL